MTANDLSSLLTKYPLLQKLCIRRLEDGCPSEASPPYIACILAALENPGPAPVCFVFPKRGDAPRVAAVLFALLRFKARESELAKKLGEKNFKEGNLVRIHPTGHIYRYLGFLDKYPDKVALETLNASGKYLFDPAEIIPRLEVTKAKKPIGKLVTIGVTRPPPAPLDLLLGTSTYGNHSALETELVILDAQNEFHDFVSKVTLESNGSPSQTPLRGLIPFGDLIDPDGDGSWLHKWDERSSGEPLIAITHSAQVISNFCILSDSRSRLIIVNGLSRLKGLQTYDDISDNQRLVVFCDHDEEQLIDDVGARGCRIWYLSGTEVVPAASDASEFDPRAVLLPVGRWARNHELLRVEDEGCGDSQLDEICLKLVGLDGSLELEKNSPPALLISRAWRLVNDAAGLIAPPKQGQRASAMQQIADLRAEITGSKSWLSSTVCDVLTEVCVVLEAAYMPDSSLGVAKGAALYRLIRTAAQQAQKWILLTRTPGQVPQVNLWLVQHGIPKTDRVVYAGGLPEDECYDQVICVSWPGGEALKNVVAKMTSPRITVLSYTFERVWVRRAGKRLANSGSARKLTEKQKREFLGLGTAVEDAAPQPSQVAPEQPAESLTPDSDVWSFERRLRHIRKDGGAASSDASDALPARYIGFVGDSYAYLTDTHKVPVATELVTSRSRAVQKLPERIVTDLSPGDYVIFPESSERELVYEVADKILGPNATDLRKQARVWKDALQASKLSPVAFLKQARELGRPKHIVTIRSWFADSAQIGPGGSNDDSKEDLELIELVTDSQELKKSKEAVWNAIKDLRGAHLSAGMRLRDVLLQKLPQVIGAVEEKGTRVDLGDLGSAWIVQVETIAAQPEKRERSQINRLMQSPTNHQLNLLYV